MSTFECRLMHSIGSGNALTLRLYMSRSGNNIGDYLTALQDMQPQIDTPMADLPSSASGDSKILILQKSGQSGKTLRSRGNDDFNHSCKRRAESPEHQPQKKFVKCYNCGKLGHMQRQCWFKNARLKRVEGQKRKWPNKGKNANSVKEANKAKELKTDSKKE